MNDWSVSTCRGGWCVSVSLSLFPSFSLSLSLSLFSSHSFLISRRERGVKKRAVSAAFHPLSIVVVFPSPLVCPRATRAISGRSFTRSRPSFTPLPVLSREYGARRRIEAMLTTPIGRCRRFATSSRPRLYATPPAGRTDPPLGRRCGPKISWISDSDRQPPRTLAVPIRDPLRIARHLTTKHETRFLCAYYVRAR